MDSMDRQIVQIIPADGWRVVYAIERWVQGERAVEAISSPLLAWGLTMDGFLVPLESDKSGWVEDPTGCSNFLGLITPEDSRLEPEWHEGAREHLQRRHALGEHE
jgi:hypothetical protein